MRVIILIIAILVVFSCPINGQEESVADYDSVNDGSASFFTLPDFDFPLSESQSHESEAELDEAIVPIDDSTHNNNDIDDAPIIFNGDDHLSMMQRIQKEYAKSRQLANNNLKQLKDLGITPEATIDDAIQSDEENINDSPSAELDNALIKGAVSLARRAGPYVSRLWKGADNAATAVNIADLAHGATQPSNGGNEAELDESESSEDELDEAIEDEDDIEYAGPGGLIRAARRAWPAIKNGAGKLAQLVNIGSAGAAVNEHATGNGGQQQESQLDEADNDYDDAVGDYDVARKSKHPRIAFVERRRSHHRTANKVTVNVNVNTHKCRRRK
jgi:hypothetical protein